MSTTGDCGHAHAYKYTRPYAQAQQHTQAQANTDPLCFAGVSGISRSNNSLQMAINKAWGQWKSCGVSTRQLLELQGKPSLRSPPHLTRKPDLAISLHTTNHQAHHVALTRHI